MRCCGCNAVALWGSSQRKASSPAAGGHSARVRLNGLKSACSGPGKLGRHSAILQGYQLVGLEQTARSVPLQQHAFAPKTVLVLGKERDGISEAILQVPALLGTLKAVAGLDGGVILQVPPACGWQDMVCHMSMSCIATMWGWVAWACTRVQLVCPAVPWATSMAGAS